MLDHLQGEIRELLDLVRQAENFDATLATSRNFGRAIEPEQSAYAERERKGQRILHLCAKWHI